MHRTDMHPLILQLLVHHIDVGTIPKVEREVGASRLVVRPQKGKTVAAFSSFQITPVIGLPHHAHPEAGVEGHGPRHVLHADGDMTETLNGNHGAQTGENSVKQLCQEPTGEASSLGA